MSDLGTTQGSRGAQSSTKRVRRLRSACTRCQRRKIRCDAGSPSCASCNKAGAECIYDDPPRLRRSRPLSRSPSATYVDPWVIHYEYRADRKKRRQNNPELADRVKLLEAIVRQEAPHVDLTSDFTNQGDYQSMDGSRTTSIPPSQQKERVVGSDSQDQLTLRNSAARMATSPVTAADHATTSSSGTLSHEVGLVSLSAGVDPKYVGPSSGYFFTQLLSAATRNTRSRVGPTAPQGHSIHLKRDRELSMRVFADVRQSLPATKSLAKQLSDTFFRTVHIQFPFLHQPTHHRLIDQVYDTPTESHLDIAYFQVMMVLSISSLIMSRRSRVELPANGWCAAAMSHFNASQVESSLEGLQSLLLLVIYAMHSPSAKFSAWYTNYLCIAMVLDLGFQRDPPGNVLHLTPYQREMRTRIFWVVYSLDRKLCTMMGRPIGIRDEACDFRFPELDDLSLDNATTSSSRSTRTTHISYAVHFFQLARIYSEIKYVLHSVQRDTPSWAFPRVRDLIVWQDETNKKLDDWANSIPQNPGRELEYAFTLCQIHYNTTKMLLLQPSPGIPLPRPQCLRGCYDCSVSAIRLFNSLYVQDLLIYNWNTCHALILHTFCLIYGIIALPGLAYEINLEDLMSDLRAASNILSATGEHWAGAKRSRDLLDEMASRAIQLVHDKRLGSESQLAQMRDVATSGGNYDSTSETVMPDQNGMSMANDLHDSTILTQEQLDHFYSTLFDVNSTLADGVDFVGNDFNISQLFTDAFDFPTVSSGIY